MYDLSKYDISLSLISKLKDNDEECTIQRASTIVDFGTIMPYPQQRTGNCQLFVYFLIFFSLRLVLYHVQPDCE